jgi:hypothetical protein
MPRCGYSNWALVCHRGHLIEKIRLRAALGDDVMAHLGTKGITKERLFPDLSDDEVSLDGIGKSIEQVVREWPASPREPGRAAKARV